MGKKSRPTITKTLRVLLVAFLSVISMCLVGAPANGADNLVDGKSLYLSNEENGPIGKTVNGLFENASLAPSQPVEDSFWIHNRGSSPGYLVIMAAELNAPGILTQQLTVGTAIGGEVTDAFPTSSPGRCRVVAVSDPLQPPLAPGEKTRVNALLTLGDLSGTQGQNLPVSLQIVAAISPDRPAVILGEEIACFSNVLTPSPPSVDSGGADTNQSRPIPPGLAMTGTTASVLILFGLVSSIGILFLLLRHRRRETAERTHGGN